MESVTDSGMVKYIPTSKKEKILSSICVGIDVVAHEKLPDGGNHWAFYLQTTSNEGNGQDGNNEDAATVQLDISPSYSIPSTKLAGGSKAFMLLSFFPGRTGTGHIVTKRIPLTVRSVPSATTVREIVEILSAKHGRHRYEFNSRGRGCRYWVREQIPLLQREEVIIDETQANEAREAILLQFPDELPVSITLGEYY